MGPGIDPIFDDVLSSLARIAQRHTKPVIDSIMRWRKTNPEQPLSSELVQHHLSVHSALPTPATDVILSAWHVSGDATSRGRRTNDVAERLLKRRDVCLIHTSDSENVRLTTVCSLPLSISSVALSSLS